MNESWKLEAKEENNDLYVSDEFLNEPVISVRDQLISAAPLVFCIAIDKVVIWRALFQPQLHVRFPRLFPSPATHAHTRTCPQLADFHRNQLLHAVWEYLYITCKLGGVYTFNVKLSQKLELWKTTSVPFKTGISVQNDFYHVSTVTSNPVLCWLLLLLTSQAISAALTPAFERRQTEWQGHL